MANPPRSSGTDGICLLTIFSAEQSLDNQPEELLGQTTLVNTLFSNKLNDQLFLQTVGAIPRDRLQLLNNRTQLVSHTKDTQRPIGDLLSYCSHLYPPRHFVLNFLISRRRLLTF